MADALAGSYGTYTYVCVLCVCEMRQKDMWIARQPHTLPPHRYIYYIYIYIYNTYVCVYLKYQEREKENRNERRRRPEEREKD